ncbi:hypothetical protein [Gorillibacterium sp. sgz500922]|uniref:hypothetical protein n=1 Tax=Gorillibacterium sp. sgz500922 TaxID=3446694 RepID=UPI003F664CBD
MEVVRWNSKKKDKLFILSIFLSSRILLFISAKVWSHLMATNTPIVELFNKWDSGWYQSIINEGYMLVPSGHEKGDAANWAFFPLYPLLVKLASKSSFWSVDIWGIVLSNIFFCVALFFIWIYVFETRNRSTAVITIFLLSYGPYSIYFSNLYTESLFILLTIMTFYFLHKEKWLFAGITGALLSATRPTGVLVALSFIIIMWMKGDNKQKWKERCGSLFNDEKKVMGLFLVPVGLFSYMTFLYFRIGDPLAFQHIQYAWGRGNGVNNPFLTLYHGFTGDRRSLYLACWAMAGIIGSFLLFRKKNYAEGLFSFTCFFIPLMSSLQSIPRYFVGSLFLIVAYSEVLSKTNDYKYVWLAALVVINSLLTFLWFFGDSIMT